MTDNNGKQFEGKEEYVKEVFTEIASYYDEMNNIMSMGMIHRWHKFMIKKAGDLTNKKCLDVGTGTGEIAFLFSERVGSEGAVVAIDITPKMVDLAKEKMKIKNTSNPLKFEVGDALSLVYEDETFDIVTSGYMLRNVTDIQKSIDEMYRVLKKGGKAIIAELARPDNKVVLFFYDKHIEHKVVKFGRKYDKGESINGKQAAYDWLVSSIEGFPHGEDMVDKLKKAGFKNAKYYNKSFGAVNIYIGTKE